MFPTIWPQGNSSLGLHPQFLSSGHIGHQAILPLMMEDSFFIPRLQHLCSTYRLTDGSFSHKKMKYIYIYIYKDIKSFAHRAISPAPDCVLKTSF
jgi:hypothetical protein